MYYNNQKPSYSNYAPKSLTAIDIESYKYQWVDLTIQGGPTGSFVMTAFVLGASTYENVDILPCPNLMPGSIRIELVLLITPAKTIPTCKF